MKIYLAQNVFDAALERIRYLFDEFPNVIVSISGGKDSTVTLNLALRVAEEKGRLPLKVLFIDQEAEWQLVIDHVRGVMADPRIQPMWLQIPIKIFNATSTTDPWLYCWEAGKRWIRDQEPNSIKINRYGTDRFKQLFTIFIDVEFSNQKACYLAGVRAEESPARTLGLTNQATYKAITWGNMNNVRQEHYTFYPLYDWSYTDIWKAIHDNRWDYCKVYDYQYQHGLSIQDMRVSNVHHEAAIHTLFYLQEVEAETWQKVTERISGINTVGIMGKTDFYGYMELPFMFSSWREYRDYLTEHLIDNADHRALYAKRFQEMDLKFENGAYTLTDIDKLHKEHIKTLLTNDYHFTKLTNATARWHSRSGSKAYRKRKSMEHA